MSLPGGEIIKIICEFINIGSEAGKFVRRIIAFMRESTLFVYEMRLFARVFILTVRELFISDDKFIVKGGDNRKNICRRPNL